MARTRSIKSTPGDNSLGSGWKVSSVTAHDICNIDIKHASRLTPHEFDDVYRNKKPLLIRGGTDKWLVHDLWTKPSMYKLYGSNTVHPAIDSNAPDYGKPAKFSAFLDQMDTSPLYVFTERGYNGMNISDGEWEHLLGPRPLFKTNVTVPHILGEYVTVGPHGTGLSFHNHAAAWNLAVWGERRWFIFHERDYLKEELIANQMGLNRPLYRPHGPAFSLAKWARDIYPHLRPEFKQHLYECVQKKGDIMYVPTMWMHAVLSNGDAVSVASTFNEASEAIDESKWPARRRTASLSGQ